MIAPTKTPTEGASVETATDGNQVIARHVAVCAGCRAAYESDPEQQDAEVLFRKAHDRRGVLPAG